MSLSSDAFRLFVTCLCYASQYLTDGVIATKIAERLGSEEFYVELLDSKLIERTESGWLISSYLKYQSSKEDVEIAKHKNKERLSKWRQKQSCNTITNAIPNKPVTNYKSVRNADVTEPHTPTPTPTYKIKRTPKEVSKPKKLALKRKPTLHYITPNELLELSNQIRSMQRQSEADYE